MSTGGPPLKEITLWNSEGVLLIILAKSGVVYKNQTCGGCCLAPREEGILLPFNNEYPLAQPELRLEAQLAALTSNVQHLAEDEANQIDNFLNDQGPWSSNVACARVDRTRLYDSHEAWIYVDVEENDGCLFTGFGRCKGVLTWHNSD